MFYNPELRRNIWLDFSFHRILITPIFLALLIYFFYLTSTPQMSASMAFNLACFFIFLWGPKRASETVIEEINNNTWDFQRQSSISPWAMTWGKLLGSTLYSWYGAIICLLFYSLLRTNNVEHNFGLSFSTPQLSIGQEILILTLGGLFSQALALLFSLQLLPQIRRERSNKTFKYFISAAIIGILMTNFTFKAIKDVGQTLTWHGYVFEIGAFTFVSLILFLGWAIVGLQRSFCKELQYQSIPWIWVLFNIFCMIYFSGLTSFNQFSIENFNINELKDIQNQLLNMPLYTAFFIAQALTYFALFTDELTPIRYKKLFERIYEKNIIESLQQLPWWTISFIFTLMAGLVSGFSQQPVGGFFEKFSPAIFILTTILFLQRDIALIHYFNFGKNPKRATGSAVLYLFLLYLLFPLLLSALHLTSLLPLLIPSWGQNTLLGIISSLAQTAILGVLCYKRWHLITQKR